MRKTRCVITCCLTHRIACAGVLSLGPCRRWQSPTASAHRTSRADGPYYALQTMMHSVLLQLRKPQKAAMIWLAAYPIMTTAMQSTSTNGWYDTNTIGCELLQQRFALTSSDIHK